MAQQAPSRRKIPTNPHNRPAAPHELPGGRSPVARRPPGCSRAGRGRAATRGGRPVIELECGITVYPAREEQGRWRAVWHENGERQQCEAASEEKLAARLAKVAEWLEGDAPNMTLRGADLIAFYMSADRLPVQRQWSRKHARTQRRLCERFAVPVIGAVPCQDITTGWAGLPPAGRHWRSSNSAATSSRPPTWRQAGGTPAARAGGPGTACGTCSAPGPCLPGSSTPPTCPAWPATPTTASPWTCTSAPPPASWTAYRHPMITPRQRQRSSARFTRAVICLTPR